MQIVYQDTRAVPVKGREDNVGFVMTWPSEVTWCIWIVPGTIEFNA